jgi:hypothetical protein
VFDLLSFSRLNQEMIMSHTQFTRSFLSGQLVITPKALRRLSRGEILRALRRHACGDPGDFGSQGPRPRVRLEGCRRLSAYRAEDGTRFLIVSEPEDVLTTVMLPEEC